MKWFKKLFKTKKAKKNKKKAKPQKTPVIVYGPHSSKGYRTKEALQAAFIDEKKKAMAAMAKEAYNTGFDLGRCGYGEFTGNHSDRFHREHAYYGRFVKSNIYDEYLKGIEAGEKKYETLKEPPHVPLYLGVGDKRK